MAEGDRAATLKKRAVPFKGWFTLLDHTSKIGDKYHI